MIKRYDFSAEYDEPCMEDDKVGDYVEYTDYAKLEAEVDRLREEILTHKSTYSHYDECDIDDDEKALWAALEEKDGME